MVVAGSPVPLHESLALALKCTWCSCVRALPVIERGRAAAHRAVCRPSVLSRASRASATSECVVTSVVNHCTWFPVIGVSAHTEERLWIHPILVKMGK